MLTGSNVPQLPVISKVALPFWLAEFLSKRKMLTPMVPSYLKKRFVCASVASKTMPPPVSYRTVVSFFLHPTRLRDDLQGESGSVDLRGKCRFFYEVGRKLCTLPDL